MHVHVVDACTQYGYFARRCIVHVHIIWWVALALQKCIDSTMHYCKVTLQVMRLFFLFPEGKGGLRRPWRLSTLCPEGVPGLLEPPVSPPSKKDLLLWSTCLESPKNISMPETPKRKIRLRIIISNTSNLQECLQISLVWAWRSDSNAIVSKVMKETLATAPQSHDQN